MRCPFSVVQVIEVSTQAFIEYVRATKGERSIVASREASRVDGSGLWRIVELELVVGSNISRTSLRIM